MTRSLYYGTALFTYGAKDFNRGVESVVKGEGFLRLRSYTGAFLDLPCDPDFTCLDREV